MTAAPGHPGEGRLGCVADDYTGGTDAASALRRQGPAEVVRQGPAAVAAAFERLREHGVRFAVADAATDDDLAAIAAACRDLPLVTGAAGLVRLLGAERARPNPPSWPWGPNREASPTAEGMRPVVHRPGRRLRAEAPRLPGRPALILAGSSSAATLEQVARARARYPSYRLDPAATPDPGDLRAKAVDWMGRNLERGTVLVYASAPPGERAAAEAAAARAIELTMAELARAAVARGTRRIVVAGGETSGAVVDGLGIDRVVVARDQDLGVPWLVAPGPAPLALLLKSGNFGRPDLLVHAAETT